MNLPEPTKPYETHTGSTHQASPGLGALAHMIGGRGIKSWVAKILLALLILSFAVWGIGDIFTPRVAGNIVAPSQIGSVEFAATKFGTQLVVVLGHTNCGAISATVDALRGVDGPSSEGLAAIVNRIRPTVEPLLDIYPSDDHALESAATRTNVIASVAQLREGSEILGGLIDSGALRIVGAQYDLASGVVEFYA